MAVDSTGKVKPTDIRAESDAMRLLKAKLGKSSSVKGDSSSGSEQSSEIDKINIELAKAINQQIDPAVILSERKDKVALLKELISKGEYKPSSEAVAKAVGDEIVQEILFAPSDNSVDNSEDPNSGGSGSGLPF